MSPDPFFRLLALVVLVAGPAAARAADADAEAALSDEAVLRLSHESFERELDLRSGTMVVGDGLATVRVPESYLWAGPEASLRVLTEAWGNPPELAQGVLGMLFPAGVSLFADEGWGVVVKFDEQGHVDDEDAADTDFAALLDNMKKAIQDANEARAERGFPTSELVGWAEPPSYDSATKKLYWAKELAFQGQPDHVVNYDVRVLGRRGVLVLSAVGRMQDLPALRPAMHDVLGFVDFNEGHRYADYVEGSDKLAGYGIAGLIGGAAAAKMGLFKMLLGAILGAKKLIVVALVGIAALLRRLFGRRRDQPAATS